MPAAPGPASPPPPADPPRPGPGRPAPMGRGGAAADLGAEVASLVAGEHADPHHLLGLHDGLVRAWRPGAASVEALLPDGTALPLARAHDAGLFAGPVPPGTAAYALRARYPDGAEAVAEDPYRFWPTVGEVDLHLFGEGSHRRLWEALGARVRRHQGTDGASFAVWAPNARALRVVGDWNLWDGRQHPMRRLGSSGVWELFVPGVGPGARYKFEILSGDGRLLAKADPMARAAEEPPATASVVAASSYEWGDADWLARRAATVPAVRPLSIYECHLGSWRRAPAPGQPEGRPLGYRELAEQLPDYVAGLGFTHVELLPVAEHPFGGSWGYQVTSYYAPTARYGTPDDFRALVDAFHRRGIGVLLDWVPAHFPRDEWALGRFDGTALYEHADPRRGEHPDWGTYVFNYGRHEVANFLSANASYWVEEFHVDGLRVDAVASMLYLDYSRGPGEWVPNASGGREDLEAVAFLRRLNEVVHAEHPGVAVVAEESTAWPGVSRPTYVGGLGFTFKWNMGWMHDTLAYFAKDPVHRRHHHDHLTFGLLYAFDENFVLPLSHDEVVHGKGSLLAKMPGDRWQRLANLRALLAWQWAHPGKQLLFMGAELAQEREWSAERALDWHLLDDPGHAGVAALVGALNAAYRDAPALWERDGVPEGFSWIDANDADANVASFVRCGADQAPPLACVANFKPVPHEGYRIGLPRAGRWAEVLNTDASVFGGSGVGNAGAVVATDSAWQGRPASAELVLPPLAVVWLTPVAEPA